MLNLLRHSLTFQILVSIFLGVLTGLFLGDLCLVFAPWEKAYIMILKITTVPYLISAVVYGIGRLIPSSAKQIFKKGLLLISSTWMINVGIVYLAIYLFPKSTNGIVQSTYSTIQPSTINFFELLIPDNIFSSLAKNVLPAVVVFGILLGLAFMHLKENQGLLSILKGLVESLTLVTRWISRITPLGTFLIIADRVGSIQPIVIKQITSYLILYILCISLVVFWIFPRIVGMLTSISPIRWLKDLAPIMLLAFTTNVVIVTLPFMVELIKKESERFYRKDPQLKEEVQGIVSIIFNLPLGAFFVAIFVFFVSVSYHMPLSFSGQMKLFFITFLTSLGTVGLGSWINSLSFILDSLGLPLSALDLYMTTSPFTAGFQSLASVMQITSLSLLTALACHGCLKWKLKTVIFKTVVTLIPIAAFALTFKLLLKLPSISRPVQNISNLQITTPVKVRVFTSKDPLPSPRTGDVFERVMQSKILRVGYSPSASPFSFFGAKENLIGYDIAFAYLLAQDLNCDLEFIPLTLSNFTEELNQGLYDVAMSGLSITEKRIKDSCFTTPYLESNVVFIMKKKFKNKYTSIDSILNHSEARFIVCHGSAYEGIVQTLSIPSTRSVIIENYDEYSQTYPNDILIRWRTSGNPLGS